MVPNAKKSSYKLIVGKDGIEMHFISFHFNINFSSFCLKAQHTLTEFDRIHRLTVSQEHLRASTCSCMAPSFNGLKRSLELQDE